MCSQMLLRSDERLGPLMGTKYAAAETTATSKNSSTEREIEVSYETIRGWVIHSRPIIAADLRSVARKRPDWPRLSARPAPSRSSRSSGPN